LDGVENEAEYKVHKETREVDMKRLLFFLGELGLHLVEVGFHGRVIIVLIPGWEIIDGAVKPSCKWDAFGTDAMASIEIRGREISWR
jgi:hypothetical protein